MPRYAALIRGVSPMNCSMPKLKKAFEASGFGDVRTVLASGNVVFDAQLEKRGDPRAGHRSVDEEALRATVRVHRAFRQRAS